MNFVRQNNYILNMEKLLTSIDYFSQLLSLEQILSYGYEFFHETLGLKASAIFYLEDKTYKLVNEIGYCDDLKFKSYNKTEKVNNIATRYGRILYDDFLKYFDEEFIDYFSPELIIPLIVKDNLFGFILSNGFINEHNLYVDTYSMEYLEGMKTLLNSTLSNTLIYRDYKNLSNKMDREIFSQCSTNQTSRFLLGETNIINLHELCIDVVRELTSSSVTSLFLHDDIRKKYIVKGYKDIIDFQNYYEEIELENNDVELSKMIYDIEIDMEDLNLIFKNPEKLLGIPAKYIIFIAKKRILGFITIAKPVSGNSYDDSVLSQIENIGKTIYLALKNANYVEEIKKKEQETSIQLTKLKRLNAMIRNVNSCETLEELIAMTLRTLEVGFKVKQGFIKLKNFDDSLISDSFGYNDSIELNPELLAEEYSNVYFSNNPKEINEFFSISKEDEDEANCIFLLPIKIDFSDLNEDNILGYIGITKLNERIDNSHILIFETLATSITPIISKFLEIEKIKK